MPKKKIVLPRQEVPLIVYPELHDAHWLSVVLEVCDWQVRHQDPEEDVVQV